MRCKACRLHPRNEADRTRSFFVGTHSLKLENVQSHERSQAHLWSLTCERNKNKKEKRHPRIQRVSPEVDAFDPVPAIRKWNADGKARRKPGYRRKKKNCHTVIQLSDTESDEDEIEVGEGEEEEEEKREEEPCFEMDSMFFEQN